MRFGYWLPVFGGWLRNVEDECMEAEWSYVRRLARASERAGFDLTLIAELNLNDIKGPDAPALDAWSTAAALAAVTDKLELMVAVASHLPSARAARQAGGEHRSHLRRSSVPQRRVFVVGRGGEAIRRGVRHAMMRAMRARQEWLSVVDGLWSERRFSFAGKYYRVDDAILEPKPVRQPRPTLYAGANRRRAGKRDRPRPATAT